MSGRTRTRWGHLAAAWALLFAAVHVYWALGGEIGLASSAGASMAARRPLSFVVFGLWGVAFLLLAGAGLAGALVRCRFAGRLGRIVRFLGWAAGIFLLVRAAAIQALLLTGWYGVRTAVGPAQAHASLLLWNPWFFLGGVFFALASRDCRRRAGLRRR